MFTMCYYNREQRKNKKKTKVEWEVDNYSGRSS